MRSTIPSLPNPDELQQALMLLHEHPYRGDDSLEPSERRLQEKACTVISEAVKDPLLWACRRWGHSVDEAEDVINDEVNTFLMHHVAKVPPIAEDALRWLYRACVNTILGERTKRSRRRRRLQEHLPDAWPTHSDPSEPAGEASVPEFEIVDHQPARHGVVWPGGATDEQVERAFQELSSTDRTFCFMALADIKDDRAESLDPREFDRKPFRLPAAKMAQLLGHTAPTVSTQWNRIKRRMRRSLGIMRARELLAEGQSIATIRRTLRQLCWDDADIEALVAELTRAARRASRGVQ